MPKQRVPFAGVAPAVGGPRDAVRPHRVAERAVPEGLREAWAEDGGEIRANVRWEEHRLAAQCASDPAVEAEVDAQQLVGE